MSDYIYQTLQVNSQIPLQGGPSSRGNALNAAVNLGQKASVALNQWAVSWRVNNEMAKRASEIDRMLHPGGGVLLCVGIQEDEFAGDGGIRRQTFLSLDIVGGGMNPQALLSRYLAQAKIVQGVPRGWRRRDEFLWVTHRV